MFAPTMQDAGKPRHRPTSSPVVRVCAASMCLRGLRMFEGVRARLSHRRREIHQCVIVPSFSVFLVFVCCCQPISVCAGLFVRVTRGRVSVPMD